MIRATVVSAVGLLLLACAGPVTQPAAQANAGVATPTTDPAAQCRDSAECWFGARCSSAAEGCALQSDEDCRASAVACGQEGRCALRGDGCVAGTDERCAAAAVCKLEGRCTARAGRCVAGSDAECAGSPACRKWGRCKRSGEVCGVTAARSNDRTQHRRIEVVAMRADGGGVLIRLETDAGKAIQELALPSMERKRVRVFDTEAEARQITRRLSKRYPVPGTPGQVPPAGGPTLLGAPSALGFDLLAMDGARVGVLTTLPAEPGAVTHLAAVRWLPNGRSALVVIRSTRRVEHGKRQLDTLYLVGGRGAPVRWRSP